MKSHLVKLVVLACVVAVGACSKKRSRRAEVVECSSISLDSKGTTLCLVQLYKWKLPDAQKAAETRAHELDSLKTFQEDSVWEGLQRIQLVRAGFGGLQRVRQLPFVQL